MTIEQLGSLGEFVSSIAVVMSLIYVAMQLKQNTTELKRTARRDVFQSYSSIRRSVYTDSGISALIVKAQSVGAELCAEDVLKLGSYYNEQLFCTVQLMFSATEGQLSYSERAWSATITGIVEEIDSETFRNYWSKKKALYPDEFLAQLDSALEATGT
ncbi:hypothetical protein E2F43_13520 [Seongchinamella unica]|uniref:Uncharacterized protein n=1 Tax=Seongchinamella unica TaxID=2547392 RepID=A0A4R5LQB9_9GAMM|nr:hypothetical protein [Seongchinamella unica]TDG12606.1 hypothetical protein E2F43_13520 [Seongchinamella unica]